jgi:hypothetical protein
LLQYYAKKHGVDLELVNQIFDIEAARLHPGGSEEKHRQEDILDAIVKWAGSRSK